MYMYNCLLLGNYILVHFVALVCQGQAILNGGRRVCPTSSFTAVGNKFQYVRISNEESGCVHHWTTTATTHNAGKYYNYDHTRWLVYCVCLLSLYIGTAC